MGNYLSREQILSGGFQTRDVEAFGGVVRVREIPADLMQKLIASGMIQQSEGETPDRVDLSKVDMIEIASRCIVDGDGKPIFSAGDVRALGQTDFMSIQAVATTAMQMLAQRRTGESADPNAE